MTTDAIAGGVAEGLLYMANSAAIKNQAQICAEGEISKNANKNNLGMNVQGDQGTRLQNTDQSALHKLVKEAARMQKREIQFLMRKHRYWKNGQKNIMFHNITPRKLAVVITFLEEIIWIIRIFIIFMCHMNIDNNRKKIPKPDDGERKLGIPTVIDRIVQQAIVP